MKCEPGCQCGRHKRQKTTLVSVPCDNRGCTNVSKRWRAQVKKHNFCSVECQHEWQHSQRVHSLEERKSRSEGIRRALAEDPSIVERRAATYKKRYAAGLYKNAYKRFHGVAASKIELRMVEKMSDSGLIHGTEINFCIYHEGRVRIPDFVNPYTKSVVEIWGRYWHRGEDPQELMAWYEAAGYSSYVIWEDEAEELLKHDWPLSVGNVDIWRDA